MNLYNKIFNQPWKFSLHQFIFLTQFINKKIFFRSTIQLSLSPSDILDITEANGMNYVTVNGINLIGAQGSLPIYYTDLFHDRKQNNDHTLIDFLNIFNNRLVTNTFNIKKNSSPCLGNELIYETKIGKSINAVGLGAINNKSTLLKHISTSMPIYFWSQRNPINLVNMLESFLQFASVKCVQFIGKWFKIHKNDRTYLQSNCSAPSLGNKFLGSKFWKAGAGIKLIITSQSFELYEKLLPDQKMRQDLEQIIKHYLPYNISYNIELKLDIKQQPKISLGQQSVLSYLGWLNTSDSCLSENTNINSS